MTFSSELYKLRTLLAESREREQRAQKHIVSIEKMLATELDINDQYRMWFKNHERIVTPRPKRITDGKTLYSPQRVDELPTVDE